MTVELTGAVFVLLDNRAVEDGSRKDAPGAGIAKNLRAQFPVSIGSSGAPYWAGGDAGITAELELARKQFAHAVLIHDQHDQIDGLAANLKAKTSALHHEKCRCTPAFGGAATGDAAAIAGANDEAAVQHAGDNRDALGRSQNLFGDALVGSGLNLG